MNGNFKDERPVIGIISTKAPFEKRPAGMPGKWGNEDLDDKPK